MNSSMRHHAVAGDAAAPEAASIWVRKLGDELRLSDDEIFALDICVTELVTNIVSYSGTDLSDRPIELCVEFAADRIRVQIRDAGRAFDPLGVAPPAPAPRLEEAIPGGFGIPLVREFSDDLHYQRSGGYNVITISIRREARSSVRRCGSVQR
jgi:anti-sigma regulatory factor (Ser/Thr protein kinase)